jgi:hypothetical protein
VPVRRSSASPDVGGLLDDNPQRSGGASAGVRGPAPEVVVQPRIPDGQSGIAVTEVKRGIGSGDLGNSGARFVSAKDACAKAHRGTVRTSECVCVSCRSKIAIDWLSLAFREICLRDMARGARKADQ